MDYHWEVRAEKRKLERDGHCHFCGKDIKKNGETILYMKKAYGQDMYYILCFDCLAKINKAMDENKDKVIIE